MRHYIKTFLILLACLIGAVCLGGDAARLEVEGVYDLGVFPANTAQTVEFTVSNTLARDVIFGKIRTSCSCAETSISSATLKPGETGTINVSLKANSLSGEFTQVFFVETDVPGQRFLRLSVTGNAVPLVQVAPEPMLHISDLKVGTRRDFVFRLTPTGEKPKLTLPDTKHSDAVAELKETEVGYELHVSLKPSVTANPYIREFRVKVAEPDDWADIVITISGKAE